MLKYPSKKVYYQMSRSHNSHPFKVIAAGLVASGAAHVGALETTDQTRIAKAPTAINVPAPETFVQFAKKMESLRLNLGKTAHYAASVFEKTTMLSVPGGEHVAVSLYSHKNNFAPENLFAIDESIWSKGTDPKRMYAIPFRTYSFNSDIESIVAKNNKPGPDAQVTYNKITKQYTPMPNPNNTVYFDFNGPYMSEDIVTKPPIIKEDPAESAKETAELQAETYRTAQKATEGQPIPAYPEIHVPGL
ncbi:MAG TPA: hypothetical protein VMR08_01645 [Patescibacteria group bacterium]|jgi:hypothetical protein|nr:hypothetical protein [Patescibacteria group bacterium]